MIVVVCCRETSVIASRRLALRPRPSLLDRRAILLALRWREFVARLPEREAKTSKAEQHHGPGRQLQLGAKFSDSCHKKSVRDKASRYPSIYVNLDEDRLPFAC